MATAKKEAAKTKTKVKKAKAKKKVGTKAIAKEPVTVPEVEPVSSDTKKGDNGATAKPVPAPKENQQQQPYQHSGGGFHGKDGGWKSYELVTDATRRFKNPMGRDVTVKAELRIPDGRSFLRVAVGRVDDRSPIGLSRQIFFEDLPFAIETMIDVYEQGRDKYIDLETGRIRRSIERGLDGIESVVSHDREDWTGRLLSVKKKMLDTLPDPES